MMQSKSNNDQWVGHSIQEMVAVYEQLKRQLRLVVNDLQKTTHETNDNIRRQRSAIENFTAENKNLRSELNDHRKQNSDKAQTATSLNDHKVMSERIGRAEEALDVAKAELAKNEAKRDGLCLEIDKLRMAACAMGGATGAEKARQAIQKNIRMLENRLDRALKAFNEAVCENRRYREQIDALRSEGKIFQSIHAALKNQLEDKKKEMANIIEQANAAYEARDTAQAQVQVLKQQADKEHQEFEREWKELGKLIENDKKMKEFMRKQNQDASVKVRKVETKVDKDMTKLAEKLGAEEKLFAQDAKELKELQSMFKMIQQATGISDIAELIKKFSDDENLCFGLFEYNNLKVTEIEDLEAEKQSLDAEIERLHAQFPGVKKVKKVHKLSADEQKEVDALQQEFDDIKMVHDNLISTGLSGVTKAEKKREMEAIQDKINAIHNPSNDEDESLQAMMADVKRLKQAQKAMKGESVASRNHLEVQIQEIQDMMGQKQHSNNVKTYGKANAELIMKVKEVQNKYESVEIVLGELRKIIGGDLSKVVSAEDMAVNEFGVVPINEALVNNYNLVPRNADGTLAELNDNDPGSSHRVFDSGCGVAYKIARLYEQCKNIGMVKVGDKELPLVPMCATKYQDEGVNDDNMLEFLGHVDKSVDVLFRDFKIRIDNGGDFDAQEIEFFEGKDKTKCIAHIISMMKYPSTVKAGQDDNDDVDETEETRPFVRDELFAMVLKDQATKAKKGTA